MENDNNDFIINEADRLEHLLQKLRTNAKKFSDSLGYSNPASIYHIQNGRNKISGDKMINRILNKYPHVSYLFLKTGKLPALIETTAALNTQNAILSLDKNESEQINLIDVLIEIREQNKLILEELKQIKKQ